MKIIDLLKKAENNDQLSKAELIYLLSFSSDSLEVYQIMSQANSISKMLTGNKAEVHAQFSLNLSLCKYNCKFCSFSTSNNVFKKASEISVEEAVNNSKLFEKNGANAIFIMTTAQYSFEKFLEISKEIRKNLKKETVLIANIGDKDLSETKKIKDVGYQGVYHALRLREGIDTNLDPEERKKSINNFKNADLLVGTCLGLALVCYCR